MKIDSPSRGRALASLVAAGALLAGGSALAQSAAHTLIPEAISITRAASGSEKAGSTARTLLSSIPTQEYSHGNPTAEEQYMVELINRARANPTAEGARLASVTDPNILFAYSTYSVDTNKLKSDFAGYPVRPPLAISSKLLTAARLHSQDMSTNNFQGHNGSNGSTLVQRVEAQNYLNWLALGENVFAYAKDLMYAHIAFNVDWGNADLGHRKNVMNFEQTIETEIGIGIVTDNTGGSHTGPKIVTEDYGDQGNHFITGVVYRDLNNNNFYDVGEGIAGVKITPASGTYYAVSSESGGYAIPITATGTMDITASGGPLGTEVITRSVTAGNINVKVDFIPGQPSVPATVTLNLPLNGAVVSSTPLNLSWLRVTGATKYHVQVASDSTFNTIVASDSTVTDSAKSFASLPAGSAFFWRVRAKNNVGWGSYSSVRKFNMLLVPVQVALSGPTSSSTVPTSNTRLWWHRGAPSEQRYWLEIATDAAFGNVAQRDTAITDTSTTVNGLTANQTYYWRVKARNGAGWGPFSSIWNFTTSTSGVENAATGQGMRINSLAPNPTSGVARIAFELSRAEYVVLTITDTRGNTVATLPQGPLAAGSHVAIWDAAGLPSGVFFCTVATPSGRSTARVVVAR
ncbi:MAG TPA: CAP domain-containing protein [Candidatus Kapabacteria bacterium]|nr:CAP domain-containing protein [Candidatus Kapabacteria bacterium]